MQQDVTPKCLQFHMMGVDKNSLFAVRESKNLHKTTTATTWGEISHPLMKTITHSLELI